MVAALTQRVPGPGGLLLAFAACGLQSTFASSALARSGRIEPIATYVFVALPKPETAVVDVQEMVRSLREGGMPVAAIAEVARVERKTVYAWLEGGSAHPERESRLAEIHGLLTRSGMGLHALWRFSARALPSGATLRQLLAAEALDAASVQAALEELRPAVQRQARREAERLPPKPGARNPVLDEVPVADTA